MNKNTMIIGIAALVVIGGTIAIIATRKHKKTTVAYVPTTPAQTQSKDDFEKKLTVLEKIQLAAGTLQIVSDAYGNLKTQKA